MVERFHRRLSLETKPRPQKLANFIDRLTAGYVVVLCILTSRSLLGNPAVCAKLFVSDIQAMRFRMWQVVVISHLSGL